MPPISFARGAPAPECLDPALVADCVQVALERDGRTILAYGRAAATARSVSSWPSSTVWHHLVQRDGQREWRGDLAHGRGRVEPADERGAAEGERSAQRGPGHAGCVDHPHAS